MPLKRTDPPGKRKGADSKKGSPGLEDACVLCRAMVQEEGYGALLTLGWEWNIEPQIMINLCDAAADISQYRHEGRSLSLAMLVGSPEMLNEVLPRSPFRIKKGYTINTFRRELHALAGLIDGRFLGIVMDHRGRILGVRRTFREALGFRYGEVKKGINPLYSGTYRHMAVVSQIAECLAFYMPPEGNIVKLFENGRMVAQYTMGDWRSTDYETFFNRVLETGQDLYKMQRLRIPYANSEYRTCLIKSMRVATLMASRNRGTILSLDLELKGRERRTTGLTDVVDLEKKGSMITELEDEELLNIASLDGAVLVDGKGRLVEFNAILDPGRILKGELQHGARHKTAINYSTLRKGAILLVVSQDGSVSAYSQGKRIAEAPVIKY